MSLIPKKSKLVKNAEELSGNKRDKRKKLVKSNTKQSDLKRPITKRAQGGLASFIEVEDHPTTITPTEFSEYSFPLSNTYIDIKQKDQPIEFEEENTISSKYIPLSNETPQLGDNSFDKILNEVSSNNPSVKNLRKFLTETARAESNFDFNVQNKAGAPAYGAFQFMDFNIKPLGVSVEQFRNNPKLQIEAAANLANQFKSQFTEEDRKLAKAKGYNENALLAGAWLGGVGGVRKVLKGEGNPSDKHWSKEGKGTTVKDRMDKFNKMQKGGTIKPSFEEYYKTVPIQKNDTTNYNLRRAYDLAPYKDMVKFSKEPEFHLNSVYKDPKTGIYNFVKSKNHPTVQLELNWYNSPDGKEFKSQYDLDTTEEYYKYIPKKIKLFKKEGGVLKYGDGKPIRKYYGKNISGAVKEVNGWDDVEDLTEKQRIYIYNRHNPSGNAISEVRGPDQNGSRIRRFNMGTPEEEAYWANYLGLEQDMIKSTNTRKPDGSDSKLTNAEFVGTSRNMDLRIQAIADTTYTGKLSRLSSKQYKELQEQNPLLVNQDNMKETYLFGKTMLDNPGKVMQAQERLSPIKQISPEGVRLSGLGALGGETKNRGGFGMMWNDKDSTINSWDTYNFDRWQRWLSSIPDRKTSLEIRSKVNLDPQKGSALLRNLLDNIKK